MKVNLRFTRIYIHSLPIVFWQLAVIGVFLFTAFPVSSNTISYNSISSKLSATEAINSDLLIEDVSQTPLSKDTKIRTLEFSDEEERISIGPYLQYATDNGDIKSLKEALSRNVADKYRDANAEVPNFGPQSTPYWFRVAMRYKGSEKVTIRDLDIQFPQLALLDIYVLNESGEYHLEQSGLSRAKASAAIQSRYFVSSLHFKKGETKWIFLKVESKGPLILPAYLWKPNSRFQDQRIQLFLFGAYYGLIVAMFFYNVFLYIWMRSKPYFYYILYIGFVGLALSMNDGLFNNYFSFSEGLPYTQLLYFADSLVAASAALFARVVLNTSARHVVLDKVLLIEVLLVVVAGISVMLHYSMAGAMLVIIFAAIIAVTLIVVGVVSSYQGYREGKFFCCAWGILCISVVTLILVYAGLVPHNSFTGHIVHLGSALEAALFSFFLADRINTSAMEKLASDRQAKVKLEESLINLDSSHQLKSDLFAMVSHELRTPMNGVVGALDLISHSDLEKKQESSIHTAAKYADKMMQLVDHMLGFMEKSDSGNLVQTPFDLSERLDNIRLRFMARCHTKGLLFEYDIASNVPIHLIGAPSRLRSILNHLLDNAVKFTDKGRVCLSVSLLADITDSNNIIVLFVISDTGVGMRKEKIDLVFKSGDLTNEEFRRLNDGVGLSLCKRTAEVMNAQLEIESKIGQGTKVQFSVPFVLQSNDDV